MIVVFGYASGQSEPVVRVEVKRRTVADLYALMVAERMTPDEVREELARGDDKSLKRLLINVPPGQTMSAFSWEWWWQSLPRAKRKAMDAIMETADGLVSAGVMSKRKRDAIGSSFDDFLREEGILEETQAAAQERVARELLGDLWDPGLRYEIHNV